MEGGMKRQRWSEIEREREKHGGEREISDVLDSF